LHPNNSMRFLSDNNGSRYNLCHCGFKFSCSEPSLIPGFPVWSNFEIADMEFWRSEAYQKFFDHLESKGGFYYEVISCLVRWTRPSIDTTTTTCSDGGTHQFIALLLLYLHRRIKYTFSVILDTATIPSNIVHLETSGPEDVVHAIPRTVLVSLIYVYARSSDPAPFSDYAPNSCLKRFENLFT